MWSSVRSAAGATDAECTIAEGDEFTANVRMRELESLKEAGSRGAGLRILVGRSTGASYTSDLSREGIDKLVHSAIELAEITTEDPHAGLPEPEELGSLAGDLQLYSADVEGLETGVKIDLAKRAEEAALSCRSAHLQFRRRVVRYPHRPSHLRQLARLLGRIPLQLLLGGRRCPWPATAIPWSATTGTPCRADSPDWNRPTKSAASPPAAPCAA